jgi:hypothetical protein
MNSEIPYLECYQALSINQGSFKQVVESIDHNNLEQLIVQFKTHINEEQLIEYDSIFINKKDELTNLSRAIYLHKIITKVG